ncbi:hypothetical protein M8J76_012510 [Diaphorina citri]|nr:hypothetical protein M8J76_012510 [Diaphorina citri]
MSKRQKFFRDFVKTQSTQPDIVHQSPSLPSEADDSDTDPDLSTTPKSIWAGPLNQKRKRIEEGKKQISQSNQSDTVEPTTSGQTKGKKCEDPAGLIHSNEVVSLIVVPPSDPDESVVIVGEANEGSRKRQKKESPRVNKKREKYAAPAGSPMLT